MHWSKINADALHFYTLYNILIRLLLFTSVLMISWKELNKCPVTCNKLYGFEVFQYYMYKTLQLLHYLQIWLLPLSKLHWAGEDILPFDQNHTLKIPSVQHWNKDKYNNAIVLIVKPQVNIHCLSKVGLNVNSKQNLSGCLSLSVCLSACLSVWLCPYIASIFMGIWSGPCGQYWNMGLRRAPSEYAGKVCLFFCLSFSVSVSLSVSVFCSLSLSLSLCLALYVLILFTV